MIVLREITSSNITDVKYSNVEDNTGTSKTVSFAYTVSEIHFQPTDLTVQDATPVPVTSGTTMRNEKPAIDTNETNNSDTSKELLQIYTKET